MPVYTCPECDTDLRTKQDVPPGKKLRCPECDFAWAPVKVAKPAAPKKAAPPPMPKAGGGDDDEGGSYGVMADEEAAGAEERAKTVFQPLKDRFKKNLRGPAMGKLTRPATLLLATGAKTCALAVIGILIAIWPMVFIPVDVQPAEKKMGRLQGGGEEKRQLKPLTDDERRVAWIYVGCNAALFLWGAGVCWGASAMHQLESYPLSVVSSVMAFVSPWAVFTGGYIVENYAKMELLDWFPAVISLLMSIPIAIWCLVTLNDEIVKEGFAEEKPEKF